MNEDKSQVFRFGFLVFPRFSQLDVTGPWEVLSSMPNYESRLVWKDLQPVTASKKGITLIPDTTFADCPQLDLLCVAGGPGMNVLLNDQETLDFIRGQAAGARYLTSVSTGSLLLGAAGLLRGKRATGYWASRDLLALFDAIPVDERVVTDGKIVTCAGVTAGIDLAFKLIAEIRGEELAQVVQIGLEYAPEPPFNSGSPKTAPKHIVAGMLSRGEAVLKERRALVEKAATAMKSR